MPRQAMANLRFELHVCIVAGEPYCQPTGCDMGWERYKDHCYKILHSADHPGNMTENTEIVCDSENAYVFLPDSEEEIKMMQTFFSP